MTKKWSSTASLDGQTKRQASKHDRRQALMDLQKEAREADPRLAEEIIRELRDEWDRL